MLQKKLVQQNNFMQFSYGFYHTLLFKCVKLEEVIKLLAKAFFIVFQESVQILYSKNYSLKIKEFIYTYKLHLYAHTYVSIYTHRNNIHTSTYY